MSQERHNGLTLIAIENDLLDNVDYNKEMVKSFASKNARRVALLKMIDVYNFFLASTVYLDI